LSGTGRLDPRSGLFSQKLLETLLSHEVIRSRRYPSPVALLYFALRYPKDASDQVTESAQLIFTNLLQSKIREADLPGLYEGNYLVIMPATDGAGARVAAERLLADFRGEQITREAVPFEMSVSIGVSSHNGGEGISASQLLSDASMALWEAQKRGPKSLVLFEEMKAEPD
jgi:diguanylate cyclase (GGDEF)-like protein